MRLFSHESMPALSRGLMLALSWRVGSAACREMKKAAVSAAFEVSSWYATWNLFGAQERTRTSTMLLAST